MVDINMVSAILFVVIASCFLITLYKLMSHWFVELLVVIFCIGGVEVCTISFSFWYCICLNCAFVLPKNQIAQMVKSRCALIIYFHFWENTETLPSLSVIHCFLTCKSSHKLTKELLVSFGMTKCAGVWVYQCLDEIAIWIIIASADCYS